MQKVYIFDLDGTLVDSMPVGIGIVLGFLDEKGISYPDDIVTTLTPLGYKGSAQYIADHLPGGYDAEKIYEHFKAETLRAYGETIPLKANVKETLEKLKAQGCRLNVLTASPQLLTDICMKRLRVYDLFENVWSIDTFGMSKADEAIYVEATRRLGVTPEECIMADDNLNVLKTAKKVGMATVGVYDESSKDVMEEMRQVADKYVMDFAELV
ncbi:MAG: HAD family phosphatase [Clostridia bacterium]|nr:HAD family phosphatase [Clostridia bacterium]